MWPSSGGIAIICKIRTVHAGAFLSLVVIDFVKVGIMPSTLVMWPSSGKNFIDSMLMLVHDGLPACKSWFL